MMEWKPDTCQCDIEFSQNANASKYFKSFKNRCKLHQTSSVQQVILHNQSFNKTADTEKVQIKNKANEKARIKQL